MTVQQSALRRPWVDRWLSINGWFVFAFLYLPIMVVIVFSFSGASNVGIWGDSPSVGTIGWPATNNCWLPSGTRCGLPCGRRSWPPCWAPQRRSPWTATGAGWAAAPSTPSSTCR